MKIVHKIHIFVVVVVVVDPHNQPVCPQMDVPRLLQQIPGAHEEVGHDQFRQEACVSKPAGDPDQGAVLHRVLQSTTECLKEYYTLGMAQLVEEQGINTSRG